jgi:hypothetical protein
MELSTTREATSQHLWSPKVYYRIQKRPPLVPVVRNNSAINIPVLPLQDLSSTFCRLGPLSKQSVQIRVFFQNFRNNPTFGSKGF